MKFLSLIISILLVQSFCNNPDADKYVGINNDKLLNYRVVIDKTLSKSDTDSFKIGATLTPGDPYRFYLNEKQSYCRLENDTLRIFITELTHNSSTILDIRVHNQNFETDLCIYGCYFYNQFKPVLQSLKLNKGQYIVGDTLIGEFNYSGHRSADGAVPIATRGKFKLLIRPSSFRYYDLLAENKYRAFRELVYSRPDTVKELDLRMSKLTDLPRELLLFKNLETLDLGYNDLSNANVELLRGLQHLKELNLQNCNLTQIPSLICSLPQLEKLIVYSNNITSFPDCVNRLPRLVILSY